MLTLEQEQAAQVPVDEQVYAFGSPVYRLTYDHGGRQHTELVVGGYMAVRAYAQRQGYTHIVVGRYLGGMVPQRTSRKEHECPIT